jgi:hypothetical protein
VIGDNFGQLMLDIVRVGWMTSDPSKSHRSSIDPALLNIPSGRFGQEEESDTEDQCPQELDSHWDSVGTSVHPILGGVDDTIGNQDTDGDTELVAGYDGTANLSRSDFREVQDDDGGNETSD